MEKNNKKNFKKAAKPAEKKVMNFNKVAANASRPVIHHRETKVSVQSQPEKGLKITENGFYASEECVKTIANLFELVIKNIDKYLEILLRDPELVEKYGDMIFSFAVKYAKGNFFIQQARERAADENKEGVKQQEKMSAMDYINLLAKIAEHK